MEIINENTISNPNDSFVATVGFFDGLHLGHRYLVNELKQIASAENRKTLLISFETHPRKVLQPDFEPALLSTNDEKIEHISKLGVDACMLLPFDVEMSKLTALEFLRDILYNKFNVRTLLVGHDHRFGHNRSEDFDDYLRYGKMIGLNVIKAQRFSTPDHKFISSSYVRAAISEGNVSKANALLGYNYSFSGVVSSGYQVGRKIGFPTANIELLSAEKLIPATGVYHVNVFVDDIRHVGMMNIGNRPTFNNGITKSVEVNIFDFENDIYNKIIKVEIIRKIRDERKFDSVDALIAQLRTDKKNVLDSLSFK